MGFPRARERRTWGRKAGCVPAAYAAAVDNEEVCVAGRRGCGRRGQLQRQCGLKEVREELHRARVNDKLQVRNLAQLVREYGFLYSVASVHACTAADAH